MPAGSLARRRHARGPRYRIRDPKALADLIRDLIATPFVNYGTVDITAQKTKINRSTWYRLLSGTHPGLTHSLAGRLETLIQSALGPEGRKRFLEAMTVPGADQVIQAYYSWVVNGVAATGAPRVRCGNGRTVLPVR